MSLWSHLQHFQLLIYTLVMPMYWSSSHTSLHSLACFACAVCSVRKTFFPWLTPTHLSILTSGITFSETGLLHWIKYSFVSSKHSVPTHISLTQHLLWHIHKLSLFHLSVVTSYDLLILVLPRFKKNVYLPCRRLIKVFGPNDLKIVWSLIGAMGWGWGDRRAKDGPCRLSLLIFLQIKALWNNCLELK